MYFCGNSKNLTYPSPVQLNQRDLPWVTSADHLGHTFNQSCSMDQEIRIKRAKYIEKTVEIRNTFSWAHPNQMIRAGDIYAGDHYGSNLWLLSSSTAEMYFKSWNTFIKLCWGVPRSTHTYLVENLLARDFLPARHQVLARYGTFFNSLLTSPNREVRLLARIVVQDKKSVTSQNVKYIEERSGLSPWDYNKSRITAGLQRAEVSVNDLWRISLLEKMFSQRTEMISRAENTSSVQTWIDSICSS